MRSFSHWNLNYIQKRLAYMIYARRNPDKPWITPDSIKILDSYLKPDDFMIEFGSGRSTKWFASKVGKLISIEHNKEWFDKVSDELAASKIANIEYRHRHAANPDTPQETEAYLDVFDELEDETVDVIFVDGIFRDECALKAINKVKPGGVILIDNVNWFLPSQSISPCSRSIEDGPLDAMWSDFSEKTQSWRRIWTTCDLSDTTFFFKP
ncbi:MAG: class I SAM-dependent methyltransferase [Hyphomicrobiales bacterium]